LHVSCLLLWLSPLARSTPFPYTTLFRSQVHAAQERGHHEHRDGVRPPAIGLDEAGQPTGPPGRDRPVGHPAPPGGRTVAARRPRDRKSTRLNSSHEWISYAVFCLKKKRK